MTDDPQPPAPPNASPPASTAPPASTTPAAPTKALEKRKSIHPLAAVGIALAVIVTGAGVAVLGVIGLIIATCSK